MRTFSVRGRPPTDDERRTAALAEELRASWLDEHSARPSKACRCAHSLVGQRHPSSLWRPHPLCSPPAADHVELHNIPGRRRVLVHHPYSPPRADDVAIFDAWWRTTTLVLPPSESWYWPGHTWRIEVWSP